MLEYESTRLDNLTEEQKKLAEQLNFTEEKMLDFLEMVQIQKCVDSLNKLKNKCLTIGKPDDTYVQELDRTIELYKKRYSALCDHSISSAPIKKEDQGLVGNWINALGPKSWWTFSIVGTFIYKIVDMNTLEWFGHTIYIKKGESIIWFFFSALLFWGLVFFVLFPILKFLGLIKGDWK